MRPWPLLLNIAQVTFAILWSIFWISAAFVVSLFSRDVPLIMARLFWGPGLVWDSGARFVVHPLPPLDWTKPHIFVMNHQSALDIACAFASLPVVLRFVAKSSLRWVPFIGWYMWRTRMVFVDRSNKTRAVTALSRAATRIRGGISLLAYPEGTRSPDGALLPFKKGPFMLAIEAQVPIVPVVIEGSGRVMPPKSLRLYRGEIHLGVCEPISTAGLTAADRDQLIQRTRTAMEAKLSLLRREAAGGGPVASSARAP